MIAVAAAFLIPFFKGRFVKIKEANSGKIF
jgi:hypothetical protein